MGNLLLPLLEPEHLQAGLVFWAGQVGGPLLSLSSLFPPSLSMQPRTAFPGPAQKSPAAAFPGEEVGSV